MCLPNGLVEARRIRDLMVPIRLDGEAPDAHRS